jgi:hypothetical protein
MYGIYDKKETYILVVHVYIHYVHYGMFFSVYVKYGAGRVFEDFSLHKALNNNIIL